MANNNTFNTSPLALGKQQKKSAAKKKADRERSASSNVPRNNERSDNTQRTAPIAHRSDNATKRAETNQRRVKTAFTQPTKNSQQMRDQKTNAVPKPDPAKHTSDAANQMRDQKSGIKGPKDAIETRVTNLTTGAFNQILGGHATTWGRDTNEANEFKKTLDQNVIDGRMTQEEADKNWNSYINSNTKAKRDLDWKESKGHQRYQAVQDWGQAKNELGDKQIEKGKEGLGTGGELVADAYTSGLGMLTDFAFGPMWAASMASRTYGNTINSTRGMVEDGIITEREAENNAAFQAGKETISEYAFRGFGLLKGAGKATQGFEGALTKGIDKLAAKVAPGFKKNLAYGLMRTGLAGAEESAEEFIAGVLDAPVNNFTYANKIDARNKNTYRKDLVLGSSNLGKHLDYYEAQGFDRGQVAAAYESQIRDDDYKQELINAYVESGMPLDKAEKAAAGVQDYMLATLSGDKEAIKKAEDNAVNILGEATSVRQRFNATDTAKAMASAAIMSGVMGGGGQIGSAVNGRIYKGEMEEKFGRVNATRAVLNTAIDLDDPHMSSRAQAMSDNGSEQLADQQWNELGKAIEHQQEKDYRTTVSSITTGRREASRQRFFGAPDVVIDQEKNEAARDEQGNLVYSDDITNERAAAIRSELNKAIEASPEIADEILAEDVQEIVESIETIALGFPTVEAINNLTLTHAQERALYESVTGDVLPASNEETRVHLAQQAAKNFVETARISTVESVDVRKGELDVKYTNSFGGEGQSVFSELSGEIDLEDPANYVQAASVLGEVYDAGRNGASLENTLDYAESQDISREAAQRMYEAGVQDSMDNGYTVTYDISEEAQKKGKIKNSDRSFFLALAKMFRINIHITDTLLTDDGRVPNGKYDSSTNTLTLNYNDAITKNVGYTITHELTHQIKRFNKDAYEAFAKSFKERAIKKNGQEWYDNAIQERIERYEGATNLTEEQALEEIIADQMGEILHDQEFITEFARQNTDAAQTVLNAIRDVIRKITQLFAVHGGFRSDYNEALLSELGLLREAEMFFATGIQEARDEQTQEMLEKQSGMKTFDFSKSDAVRNIKAVANMNPVSELTGDEFSKGEADLVTQVSDYFNSIGNNAYNGLIGDVELVRDGVKSDIGHGIGRQKAISFMAVPNVITNGKVIDARLNWKGRGKDTVVISAPIRIGNEDYYMAVVVERNKNANTQRFYVHEVFLHQKNTGKPFKTFSAKDGKGGFPAIFRILSLVDEVKNSNYSESEISRLISTDEGKFSLDSEGRRLSPGQREFFKDSEARDRKGKLIPLFHTTSKGGFTIFDPSKSKDSRSLFFASKFKVSQTYAKDANKPINLNSGEEQAGFYECYLNLENPLIIEGNGSPWSAITHSIESTLSPQQASARLDKLAKSVEDYDKGKAKTYVADLTTKLEYDDEAGEYVLTLDMTQFNRYAGEWEKDVFSKTFRVETPESAQAKAIRDLDDKVMDYFYGITTKPKVFKALYQEGKDLSGNCRVRNRFIHEYGDVSKPKSFGNTADMFGGVRTKDTNGWAAYAQNAGYDGVIFRDVVDLGTEVDDKIRADGQSDIYVAFDSNQVKSVDNLNPTEDIDIRYSLDSEGRELTQQQQEFFKESKIRDENGQLLVVYHGTSAEFDVFKNTGSGHYFTANPKYAERYGSNVRAFYLNIVKPFDVTQDSVRDDFVQFVRDGYSNSLHPTTSIADIYKSIENGIDWTEADNLIEWIEENELDYDGLVIDEGGDLDENGEVFDRGNSYVSFNSNQAKLTSNENPTENENVKFSMDAPYEETRDLVAVHNVKESDIAGLLKLNGIPMPSIAVIKAAQGHDMYGEYSFIFGKDTIDPAKNKANKVYGGDAWTPVFPTVEYEVKDDKAFDAFRKKIAGLTSGARQEVRDTLYGLDYTDMFNDKLRSNNGLEKFKEALLDDTRMMQVFLDTKGQYVDTIVKKEEDTMSPAEVEKHKFIIDKLGEDVVRASVPDKSSGVKIGDYRKEYLENNGDAIKQAYKAYGMEIIGLPEAVVDQTIEGMNRFELFKIPRTALQYLDEGPTKVKETPDYRGTEDAIREKTDEAEYKKWLDDLFGGLTIQEGLYNGKDYYTPSGDRRSFKETHMDATLNNIVKAMKLHENGETMLGHSFKAVAQKKYDSIADIKADSKRLEKMSEEEYSEKNKEFADRESKIIDRFFDDVKMGAYDNPFIIRDTINTILVDSIRNAKSSADVLRELKEYPYTKNATKADADAIWQLVEDVANMPTGYFEAKPERAVTFDEVQAVIAPDNAPSEIIDGLKEQNVDVVTYEAGNEGDRKDKLNSLNNAMFSIDAAKVDVSKHKTVKLSKKDYAIVYHSVVAKNASIGNSNEHLIDYTFTDNLFVMYETWGDDSFRVFMKKSIGGNEDYIQEVTDGFREDAPNLDSVIESVRNRRRRRSRNNADASGRGAGETDDRLDRQESNSIEVSDSNAGSGAVNERVELTPVVTEDAVIQYSIGKKADGFTSFAEDCLEGDTSDEAQARRQKARDEVEAALANIVRKETQLTYGKTLNRKSVKKPIKDLVLGLMESSENTHRDKMDMVDFVMDSADAVWNKFYSKAEDLSDFLLVVSREVVENIKFVDDEMYQAYQELRTYLRENKISVPEFVKEDISWADYRKQNFGRMKLTTESGFELDKKWDEIARLIMPFVDATEYTPDGSDNLMNVEDMSSMFLAISDALDNTKAYRDAYADAFAQDIELQFAKDLAAITIKQGEAWESFADKKKEYYETRAKEMQARHKVAMRELREQRDKKLAEAEQKRKDDLAKQKQKYQERDEKRKAEEREKKEKQRAKKQDHRARMKAFGHIEKNYKWLTKRLLDPKKEDGQHIPEGFINSLASVLSAFDLQTERSKSLEERTGKVSKPTEALRKMREELQELSKEDESGIFVYNGALFSIMDKLIKSLDGHPLRDVNTEDLTNIDDMLASIKHMIQNENKLFADSKKEAAASAGESIIEDMGNKIARYKRRYDRKGPFGGLDHLLNEDMMTPMNFFKALGGQMHQLYKNLRYGQDDYIRKIDELRGFFDELFGPYRRKGILGHANTGSDIYDWSTDKSVQTFKLASGEEIQLSVAQMMSLYCHSKREQSMKHILGSGVVISDVKMTKFMDKLSGKVDVSASGYRMTYDDVVKITDALTDEQKEIAQKIQELMNGKLQEWGNETSMQLYGIRLFKEKNYFPIAVNNEDVPSQIGKASGVTGSKISNFGFTKDPDPKAANRLIIADIFEVVSDHANKMALYSAYAAPLTDFNRVLNYKQKVVQKDNQGNAVSVVDGYSVKGRIKDAYGSNAISFINNFLNDVNGQAEVRIDGVKSVVDKSLARVKKASIAANLRVLVQQPTAIVRAAYYINPIHFANPSEMNLKKNIQEMHEHCPIAAWKAWGNYQNDFTRGLQDIITNNGSQSTASAMWETATMGVYGMADDMTWGMIWGAVKNEVKAKHPTVKYGSEEFWILCNERASLVFDETQVVDSVFHRSDVMRSKDTKVKTFSSFMAEPTRTYNMVRSSVVMSYRLGKDGKYKEAADEMAKALAVFAANAAAVSAAAALVDALRGKGGDDDDEYWELWYMNFMNNFTDNLKLWNNIVYAKDILGLLEPGIRKWFGDDDAYVYQPSNMVLNGWYKLATGLPDTKAFLTGEMSLAEFISGDFVAGLGYITGVPAKTIGAWLSRQMDKWGVFATDETEALKSVNTSEANETLLTKLGIGSATENYQKRIDKKAKKYRGKSDERMVEMATDGYRKLVDSGDFSELSARREAIRKAGGDVSAFDDKIHSYVNSTYKKTIGSSKTQSEYDNQQAMREWMLSNGWTEQQVSEVAYKSDTARDFKAACRMLDHDAAVDALVPLLEAGLTKEDVYKLWDNRNRGNYDTTSTGTYVWGTEGTITSGFGNRGYVTAGASSYHQGIDIGAEMGTKVIAADGGVVTFAGNDGSGYGNYIIVTHDNGSQTYYGHLSGIGVKKGQRVSQSQPIGNVGSTGVSTGPHLHFALKINGTFVDPSKYIKQ